jgi:glycosyltransferase involved in cell wall biosynthesis
VVVPVFNGMPYLQAAYESIVNQTYQNIEIVFVDGGSSDASLEWLHDLDDPRASVAYLDKGTPAAGTWTAATAAARGDFIKLLCQDDLLYPRAVEAQVNDLTVNPGASVAVAQRDIISASGRMLYRGRGLSRLPVGLVDAQRALRTVYLEGTNIFGEPHALLFRSSALLGAMPWTDDRPYLLDLDTYTRVLEAPGCLIVVRRESIGAFRVSTSSWSTRLVATQRQQLRIWQHEYEARHQPSRATMTRAAASLTMHNQLRRLAYWWLARRRDLD